MMVRPVRAALFHNERGRMSNNKKFKVLATLIHNGDTYAEGSTVELTIEQAKEIGPKTIDLSGIPNKETIAAGTEELAANLKAAIEKITDLEKQLAEREQQIDGLMKQNDDLNKHVAELISHRDDLLKKLDAAEKKTKK